MAAGCSARFDHDVLRRARDLPGDVLRDPETGSGEWAGGGVGAAVETAAQRVLAELRLGLGFHVGRKRVARLMRLDGLVGDSHRRKRRGWKPDTATHEDLAKRQFRADAPNRL